MRVIAVDPGYDRIGVAVLEGSASSVNLVFSTCIETDKQQDIYERIFDIGKQVNHIIDKYQPDAFAIEELYFSRNVSTALKVSEAKGVIVFQALDQGIPVVEYTPNQVKVATTGYGRATKTEVHKMVLMLTGLDASKKVRDDEVDAIAVGITHLTSYKHPN